MQNFWDASSAYDNEQPVAINSSCCVFQQHEIDKSSQSQSSAATATNNNAFLCKIRILSESIERSIGSAAFLLLGLCFC